MKYLVLTALAAMFSATSAASQQCTLNAHVIKANYQQQQGQQSERQFGLWRLNDEVAHQAIDSGIVEKWQRLKGGQVRPVRL